MTSFWIDRPTLVTGATGLVGGWLVKRLLAAQADVVCLVRDWVPQCELVRSGDIERARVVRGDIRDQALLERILGEYEIDTVIHLAAQTIVGIANRNPVSTFETNIQGTWCLLEACRRSPTVKQIVVASSDKAYGDQEKLPYDETTPLQGQHPYDVSKSCADLISHTYAKTYELPVAITRCGNFYGGGDLNWNRIVPGTIRSLLRGERPVIRSDGSYIRDYFYVEDGAAAYMLLAEQLAKRPELRGEAFNFSNEIQVSVLQLVRKICQQIGSSLEPVVLNETRNEIKHQYLSADKARRVLGWHPLFTLEEGLERTIAWYRRFFSSES
ncbi:GDP-mannose 4,6-dehydratase [Chthonomonas calidirosea]|uniref:Nucleoside-diphosphate-sugar epimerases n=1 Tax=Chthonomonas calidirosea (strain DSM 23976 / ICMP 18418 / T49) TaxID=1303518 RepID=S0EUU1_CHTCT|nr:GDP-mannose 4,6-dehydratase [Chthonomonas calidirosea]CCW35477.1 Nucleoside-diphosphate-sugar epimerases [Chthonomonas calidirosea T49]CEK19171.1 nucleoside-diphosphate-sugar epimerase [Chthonomonas calidirosea]CEK20154.1 nucleoside-diphosphate-sugar epimerase [Chthonomonas calidirosea]